MYVDDADSRPPSLLIRRRLSALGVAGGALVSLLAHGLVAAFFVVWSIADGFSLDDDAIVDRDDTIIAAELVRLGREFDPTEMPNREVPRLAKQRPNTAAPSANPTAPQDVPDAGPPQPHAEASLDTVIAMAQPFAEDVEPVDLEGLAGGVEGGTAREATEQTYMAQIGHILRRGWTVPTVISDAEKQRLSTTVVIEIDEGMNLRGYRVVTESGNPLFDQSVTGRLELALRTGLKFPDPPPDLADQFRGAGRRLVFRGRDAQ